MKIINEGLVAHTPEEETMLEALDREHYLLRFNEGDKLELFVYSGGHPTAYPYTETTTTETFHSIADAHHWVFGK